MSGKFIIIVGPSGSGKTEIVKKLLQQIPNSARLITCTTRTRRVGEGEDYFFISRTEFEKRLREDDFFEHAEVYGNLYGSSRQVLADYLAKYKFVFAIIDVQGAQTLKNKIKESFVIFIRPGSLQNIHQRLLQARAEVSAEELQKRLNTAATELALAETFDAIVDNPAGQIAKAVSKITDLINSIA